MKVYVYYLKSTKSLFALTRYIQFAEDFELTYDMSKFIKEIEDMDKVEYTDSTLAKYKLWGYSCITKDLETIVVCMTKDMMDRIHKASDNIHYTFKSLQITTTRYKEIDGIDVDDKFMDAVFDIAYSTDITGNDSLDDNNIFAVSTYRVWTDVYSDIINIISKDELSKDRSIDASRLLGVYKYQV